MLVNKNRIEKINEAELKKKEFVAYWMQSSQRLEYNQALGYAVEKANQLNQPLLIFFLLNSNFPEAEYGHFKFMLQGLKEIKKDLKAAENNFYIVDYQNLEDLEKITEKASLVVSEKVYLKHLRQWKSEAAERLSAPFYLVESNLVCPIEEVSEKEEYAAYTIRKKINSIRDKYLKEYQQEKLQNKSKIELEFIELNFVDDLDQYLEKIEFKQKIDYANYFVGGYQQARQKLEKFVRNKLKDYDQKRNIPHLNYQSDLSPYLHFGQISAQEVALEALNSGYEAEPFLEELIVRRELAFNFIYYNQNYDGSLKDVLYDWAYQSLMDHQSDEREYLYDYQELENAETHDQYWNAAQKEMLITGKMHNYMRMYWGKKILEWTADPETAYQWALKLNNKYSLDGRDPNSYAGVAWVFSKHDRAWQERKIYGKVRYMNARGLERKFEMDKYLNKINNL
ncbi:deoxyribodipyrimidine photo-lyase [Halanaerobium saccharolyticum]|uniref:Deoxyribodipyrimidine photo-lyase n=1 Tax=Halanaerobium saccharolyticum TaxID=43595 RepID=A0A4R7YWW0_9FIRM|nr:deoxyribodipyrimidine photo-lyase [Halanaerobium saccharolyticum]RAK06190.1 deoxyribodipyrimidine photo-lyase [Halanaerobium saccharolyticum]TDW00555.1 deoxyribodipyrimidine photo-lyase [Halanaerobium saccharolyticum]TDX52220.1 deoxyribodipyrimidine photo-lyase [Halanaerobium saccharolyticum]